MQYRFLSAVLSLVALSASSMSAANVDPLERGFRDTVQPFVRAYCVECHGGEKPKAELDLSTVRTLDAVTKDVARWDQVLERVEAGEMPPDDAEKQPNATERAAAIAWLKSMHAAEVQRNAGDPGIVLARRLSNAEYDYTIRDLTGVDIHPTREFPVDPANGAGFDNSGESLAMSPSLVKKYLDAARLVADHIVFTPEGFSFAPYPMTTYEDRDKYAVHRVVDFYRRQSLDWADFFVAAWRFQHRAELGRANATLADFAREAKLSSKYLATIWETLTTKAEEVGPIAAMQERWRKLPAPVAGKEPEAVREGCVALREFAGKLRPLVKMEFPNLIANGRIIATGSQTFVLWKDQQYAANRRNYAGNAQKVDLSKFVETDPRMKVPADEAARTRYEEGFKRFCAAFPDAFYISERPRMFITNPRDIVSDLRGHRLLTAGFHSQMGYFRDDQPLYEMVLDDTQRRELDRLWHELEFITHAPIRQFRQFVAFERTEPPSFMFDPVFANFRPEDDDLISEATLNKLADVYHEQAAKKTVTGGRGRGGNFAARGPARPNPTAAPGAVANALPPATDPAAALTAVAANAADPAAAANADQPGRGAPVALPVYDAPATIAIPSLLAGAGPGMPPPVAVTGTPAATVAEAANAGGTPATPPAPAPFKLDAAALQAVRDYFPAMNARIRALEKDQREAEPRHLESLVAFAERASRRPLAPAEKDDLRAFYRSLREQPLSHEDAIRDSVVSVLMSPAFVYRVDLPKGDIANAPRGVQPLSDYELANRLSYFLWSSLPDAELMARAAAGDLHRPDVLTAQARRMMQDPRVRGFVTEFAGNWLDVRRFEEHNAVDRERFPAFTPELRAAMFEEPIRFTMDLVQRNGSVLDFVYGRHTFVNGVLAKHYGMPAPAADVWQRVDDATPYQRGGLLPMAVFLTKNAPGLRTSPVKRGHWVVTRLLGERIPPPPPNVPTLPADETKLGELTLRETLARHREDKACASCHNKIDSFGLVFEGYGPTGEVRATDLAGRPTETTAKFPGGSEGTGVGGLQAYVRTKVEREFIDNLSRKLMVYALGRSLIPSDELVIAAIREKLSSGGYHFNTIVEQIVTSPQFLHKRVATHLAKL